MEIPIVGQPSGVFGIRDSERAAEVGIHSIEMVDERVRLR